MGRELKAGVAGAGIFGGFHAQKYAQMAGVELVAVFDADATRAAALAQRHGARAFTELPAFLRGLDLVTVATPAATHAELALSALGAGAHVYVEKPVATREADAAVLLAAAETAGRVLAVGHQERVIFDAIGLIGEGEPVQRLQSVRRGLANPRNRDVSCVLDLMIHDLDLADLLARGPVRTIEAHGDFDTILAEVSFTTGLVARFEASRAAPARRRTMRLDYPSGPVEIDFLAPAMVNRSAARLDGGFADGVASRDPLGASIATFVRAVRGEGTPLADGAAGARALALARAIEAAAGL